MEFEIIIINAELLFANLLNAGIIAFCVGIGANIIEFMARA